MDENFICNLAPQQHNLHADSQVQREGEQVDTSSFWLRSTHSPSTVAIIVCLTRPPSPIHPSTHAAGTTVKPTSWPAQLNRSTVVVYFAERPIEEVSHGDCRSSIIGIRVCVGRENIEERPPTTPRTFLCTWQTRCSYHLSCPGCIDLTGVQRSLKE